MSKGLEAVLWVFAGVVVAVGIMALRPAVVGGRSMEPALVPGDVCIASPWARPRRGDVILFSADAGRPVLHRVLQVGHRGELRTQGDANSIPDSDVVQAAHVRGRVVAVFPLGRALRGWMRAVHGATLLSPSRYSGDDGEAFARFVGRPGRGPSRLQGPPGTVRAVHSISCDLKARARGLP